MTTYFISRHPGAIEWARRQNLHVDTFMPHLDPALVQGGDTVIGSLPVNLAAQVCARDAAYWHLSLELPAGLRGQELSADELERLGAHLQPFEIKPISQRESQLHTAQAMCRRLVPAGGPSWVDELITDRRTGTAREEQ
jgi:CRISPR-associated protein Csx16